MFHKKNCTQLTNEFINLIFVSVVIFKLDSQNDVILKGNNEQFKDKASENK